MPIVGLDMRKCQPVLRGPAFQGFSAIECLADAIRPKLCLGVWVQDGSKLRACTTELVTIAVTIALPPCAEQLGSEVGGQGPALAGRQPTARKAAADGPHFDRSD
jgi:hypothetical protein